MHRSGTSLLFKCLRDHPQISGFQGTGVAENEGQLLQSVYPAAKKFGGPGRFGFNPNSYLNEKSSLVSENNAAKIFGEWSKYWDLKKSVLLEKSPPNLIHTRYLQALFPNSLFIIVLRHPIATSYATKKWRLLTPVYYLLEHWLLCHERFDRDRTHIRNLFVLKYEDFVVRPQAFLNSIFTFLQLEHVSLNRQVRSDINTRYFSRWQRLQQGRLSRTYAALMVRRFERRVNRFGYSLKDLHRLEESA